MWKERTRKAGLVVFLLPFFCIWFGNQAISFGGEPLQTHPEFSGTIVKQVNGKRYQAQVFAKEYRLRLEYKYALRTDHGYAAIEIIRPDRSET